MMRQTTTICILPKCTVVNKPVKLIIRSQDVIHDVGLPHFRLKMDAVPGVPTTLMVHSKVHHGGYEKKTGMKILYMKCLRPDVRVGHYSMRGVIVVETQEEFDKWMAAQKPQFLTAHPNGLPPAGTTGAADAPRLEGNPVAHAEEH